MKFLRWTLGPTIAVLGFPVLLVAQRFDNLQSSFDGQNVIITYDLISEESNAQFSVTVYSSHDRYTIPVKAVKGDVGDGVLPGEGHVIVWEARNNLPADFSGEIVVKLKGGSSLSVLMVEPLASSVYRKGEDVPITWKGGLIGDKVVISLTKKNAVKKQLVQAMDNNHGYTWKIPRSINAGKHYGITVAKVGETTDLSTKQPFRIKARIPLWLKVLPLVAAGVVVGVLAGSGDDNDELPAPKDWPNG